MDKSFLFRKVVDWSVIETGMAIPIVRVMPLKEHMRLSLNHGDKVEVSVKVNNKTYDAIITNLKNDNNYDKYQILYKNNKFLLKAIKTHFKKDFDYFTSVRKLQVGKKRPISSEIGSYIDVSLGDSNTFVFDMF